MRIDTVHRLPQGLPGSAEVGVLRVWMRLQMTLRGHLVWHCVMTPLWPSSHPYAKESPTWHFVALMGNITIRPTSCGACRARSGDVIIIRYELISIGREHPRATAPTEHAFVESWGRDSRRGRSNLSDVLGGVLVQHGGLRSIVDFDGVSGDDRSRCGPSSFDDSEPQPCAEEIRRGTPFGEGHGASTPSSWLPVLRRHWRCGLQLLDVARGFMQGECVSALPVRVHTGGESNRLPSWRRDDKWEHHGVRPIFSRSTLTHSWYPCDYVGGVIVSGLTSVVGAFSWSRMEAEELQNAGHTPGSARSYTYILLERR